MLCASTLKNHSTYFLYPTENTQKPLRSSFFAVKYSYLAFKTHNLMRIFSISLLIFGIFSCSEEAQKEMTVSNEITEYITKRYQTGDITSIVRSETKKGKEENYFEIKVGKSPVMDNSKSRPQLFTSDIAFRVYCGMDEAARKKYDIISVKITQKNEVTVMRYSNKELLDANTNLIWLDKFFRMVEAKDYQKAKEQFNAKLVDTATVDLKTTYESLSFSLGNLKNHELQGFEIVESKVGSKTYRVLQASYISFYEKQYTLSKYALLMDEPEQKLVNMDIQ
jgi:hypothetical protein